MTAQQLAKLLYEREPYLSNGVVDQWESLTPDRQFDYIEVAEFCINHILGCTVTGQVEAYKEFRRVIEVYVGEQGQLMVGQKLLLLPYQPTEGVNPAPHASTEESVNG